MAVGTQTSHKLRHLLADPAQPKSPAGAGSKQATQQAGGQATQAAAAAGGLPSSNSTVRHVPKVSEQCYQLAVLARLPKAARSSDFAAAAYSLIESSLDRVQTATGLPTLQADRRTGGMAVSLTGMYQGPVVLCSLSSLHASLATAFSTCWLCMMLAWQANWHVAETVWPT